MIMDITIHNLFINEENPCNEWEQNRREKWNQAVKDITSSTMRILYSEGFISMFIFVLYFFPLLVPYLFRNDTCRNIQSCGASLPPTLLQAASPVYVWLT